MRDNATVYGRFGLLLIVVAKAYFQTISGLNNSIADVSFWQCTPSRNDTCQFFYAVTHVNVLCSGICHHWYCKQKVLWCNTTPCIVSGLPVMQNWNITSVAISLINHLNSPYNLPPPSQQQFSNFPKNGFATNRSPLALRATLRTRALKSYSTQTPPDIISISAHANLIKWWRMHSYFLLSVCTPLGKYTVCVYKIVTSSAVF